MKWTVVFVVALLGVLAWSPPGHAEKVKANQSTKLFSRAGEQSPVVLKLKAGQSMTVLAKEGRWLKVRVSGRTGWIPRSKVDMPSDDDEIARNTRRRPFVDGRGTKRGFGGEGGPDDRIGADATGAGDEPAARPSRSSKATGDEDDDGPSAKPRKPARASKGDDDDEPAQGTKTAKGGGDGDDEGGNGGNEPSRPMAHVAKATPIYNDPDSKSDASFTAQPRTALYIVEEKGKWTFVENDEGDAGYVLTSKLDVEAAAAGGPRSRAIDLRGRIGFAVVSQSVTTPGGTATVPDNYTAGSSSATLALGGSLLYPYRKRYWLGGELTYELDRTLFGGIENTQAGMKTVTGFSYHNFNLRAVGGYDLQNKYGMIGFARLGYHYDSFQVSDVTDFTKNTAKLPNQIIQGPTLGGALAIPRLTRDIGIKASLDIMVIGASVQQTKNLEDGTGPGARAVYFGAGFTYRWKPRMDIQATYDLAYTSLSFSGAAPATSMRGHTGTSASSGSDLSNTLSVGIAYAL
ncbi:MAG TPA: SH3 domain-containing protein [Kofleriaceae bacterium]